MNFTLKQKENFKTENIFGGGSDWFPCLEAPTSLGGLLLSLLSDYINNFRINMMISNLSCMHKATKFAPSFYYFKNKNNYLKTHWTILHCSLSIDLGIWVYLFILGSEFKSMLHLGSFRLKLLILRIGIIIKLIGLIYIIKVKEAESCKHFQSSIRHITYISEWLQ